MDQPFPAYKGDGPYVFVCYSHADPDVYPEIRWLQDQGVNVWYDEGISAGKVWRAEIVEALEGAAKFLYYISPASLESAHCNREVDYALDKELDIVPVYLEKTELTPELRLALNRVQALHRDTDQNYRQHLLGALGESALAPTATAPSRKRSAWPLYMGLGLVVALLAGGGWWYLQRAASPVETSSPVSVEEERIPILAVLPLVNISGDPDQAYFGDGFAREIYTQMTRLSGLRVIAMQSTLHFRDSALDIREIGNQLGADYLVEGSVNRSGNLARININVIDARNGTHLLGRTYDRSVADMEAIFAIYDGVGSDIGSALEQFIGEQLADSQPTPLPTESIAAYNLRQQGESLAGATGDWVEALKLVDQALAIDPDYVDAQASRVYMLVLQADNGLVPAEASFRIARREVLEILRLNPDHPNALLALGILQVQLELDFGKAMATFERAEQLGAYTPIIAIFKSALLLNSGLYTEALTLMREAEIIDPVNASVKEFLARCLQRTGDIEASYAKFDEALALQPRNRFNFLIALAHSFYLEDMTRARTLVANALPDVVPDFAWPVIQLFEGDSEPLRTLMEQWEKNRSQTFVPANFFVHNYYWLGDYENHIRWYAIQEQEWDTLYFTNLNLSWFGDYWNNLEQWARSDPDKQAHRLALVREHRERIDRITEKMVL